MGIVSRHRPPDSRIERKIVTAMIVSDQFLQQVQSIYNENSLRLKYTKAIGNWCIEYYREFKKSPKNHIEDIFHKKTKVNFPQEQADEISDFLQDISEEYAEDINPDNLNVEYLLQETENHFRLSALDNLKVQISKAIISGKVEEGESRIKAYERPVRQVTKGVEPFTDYDALVNAFGDKDNGDRILSLPGELGKSVGDLERGHLVCFVANTGVGKSWWLLQMCWWAMMSGHDSLFVSYEMSHKKITTRTYQWMTGMPIGKYPETVYIPKFDCVKNAHNDCVLRHRSCRTTIFKGGQILAPEEYPEDYQPCTNCQDAGYKDNHFISYVPSKRNPLNLTNAVKGKRKFEKFQKRAGRLKVAQFPSGSQSIDDLRIYLQNLSDYEDFNPSLVATDYAKKMKPIHMWNEKRHNISDIFQDHKGLAQEKNILVTTAHQGNTVREGKDLKAGNWAEAISGLHECDVSMMINQSPHDKKAGLYRISAGKVRDGEFNELDQIYVLNNLKIGRPYLSSKIIK